MLVAGAISALFVKDPQIDIFKYLPGSKETDENPTFELLVGLVLSSYLSLGAICLVSPYMGARNRFVVGLAVLGYCVATGYYAAKYSTRPLSIDVNDPTSLALVGIVGALSLGLILNILEPGILTADKSKASKSS